MKVVVAGGSGFIGRALCGALAERGDEVTILTRDPRRTEPHVNGVRVREWTPRAMGAWSQVLEGADALVGLTGEAIVGKRWSEERKGVLRASRVDVTRVLVQALAGCARRPRVFVSTSAVGFYGPRGEGEDVTEEDGAGDDFLARLCADWEAQARAAEPLGVRVVLLRNGIVLGRDGGALAQMVPVFRKFVGGPLGSGRQPFPWIHIADVVGAYLFAIDTEAFAGPANVTAPNPVSMRELCKALGAALGRPSWAPVPGFVVRALFGEGASALLTGQRAVPRKLQALGYRFRFETAARALEDLLARRAA